jgi:hypothetical protein
MTPGRRVRWIRLVGVTAAISAGLLSLATLLPLPPGLDASTLCYPWFGPYTRFSPALSDSARALAVAHEQAHQAQCRRLGATLVYYRQAVPRKRLVLELEAYCAEADVELGWGRKKGIVRYRILEEIASYTWFTKIPGASVEMSLDETCPQIHR